MGKLSIQTNKQTAKPKNKTSRENVGESKQFYENSEIIQPNKNTGIFQCESHWPFFLFSKFIGGRALWHSPCWLGNLLFVSGWLQLSIFCPQPPSAGGTGLSGHPLLVTSTSHFLKQPLRQCQCTPDIPALERLMQRIAACLKLRAA